MSERRVERGTAGSWVARLVAFLAVLVLLQTAVGRLTLPETVRRLDLLLAQEPDILLLGNSTAFAVEKGRNTGISLGEALRRIRPGLEVADYAYLSSHPLFYEEVCRHVAAAERRPRGVVIPVNLTALSPVWDLHPAWQWLGHRHAMDWSRDARGGWLKPAAALGAVSFLGEETTAEYEAVPVAAGGKLVGRLGAIRDMNEDTGEANRRLAFAAALLPRAGRDHRMIRAVAEASRALSAAGILPIVYISPVDHGRARSILGDEFEAAFRSNREAVARGLEGSGALLLDLSELLPPDSFSHMGSAPEHMTRAGLEAVARSLAVSALSGLADRRTAP